MRLRGSIFHLILDLWEICLPFPADHDHQFKERVDERVKRDSVKMKFNCVFTKKKKNNNKWIGERWGLRFLFGEVRFLCWICNCLSYVRAFGHFHHFRLKKKC